MDEQSAPVPWKAFRAEIEAMRARAVKLRQLAGTTSTPAAVLSVALEELDTVLEELRTAEEELRRQAEESAEAREAMAAGRLRYDDLFESVPDPYLVTDPEGHILEANLAAARLLSFSRDAVLGKPLAALVLERDRREFRAQLNRLRSLDRLTGWLLRLQPSGGAIVEVEAAVGVVRERRGKSATLRWLLRVGERKRLDELEAADRVKDEFLAMLGHELRNPMGAAANALEALERIGVPAEGMRLHAIVARQMRKLARLVDDLLDVSRIKSEKIAVKRKPLDLRDVARRCVESIQASEAGQRHELLFLADAEPVVVEGDRVRLEQILGNLLDNAAKYSPAGSPIRLIVEREGGQAVVRVQDCGIGLAPETLETIFDPFVQLEISPDRPRRGLGVGLAVTRALVERHGGTITATSAGLGHGSEFAVRLPLSAAPLIATPALPTTTTPTRRVVIVEDYADAREALQHLLMLEGHRVETAADGGKGLDLILSMKPDIALIDLQLPGLNGYEVARRVRASREASGVYLVALTGHGQPRDRQRGEEAGFDAYLVKPVNLDEVALLLARVGDEKTVDDSPPEERGAPGSSIPRKEPEKISMSRQRPASSTAPPEQQVG
jgi:PAS domain S-box-containing protein